MFSHLFRFFLSFFVFKLSRQWNDITRNVDRFLDLGTVLGWGGGNEVQNLGKSFSLLVFHFVRFVLNKTGRPSRRSFLFFCGQKNQPTACKNFAWNKQQIGVWVGGWGEGGVQEKWRNNERHLVGGWLIFLVWSD